MASKTKLSISYGLMANFLCVTLLYMHLKFDIQLFLSLGEANKQVSDYKFRLKKAEQEITTLQSNVSSIIEF